MHLRRIARTFLRDDAAVKMLFDEIGPMVGDRPGGYTRVIKSGFRRGDGGEKAIIEFVDFNYVQEKEKVLAEKEKSAEDSKDSKKSKKESKTKSETPEEKSPKTKKSTKKKTLLKLKNQLKRKPLNFFLLIIYFVLFSNLK